MTSKIADIQTSSSGTKSVRWRTFLVASLGALAFVGGVMFLIFMHNLGDEGTESSLRLQLLPQSFADSRRAYCLDGSLPAFYMRTNESANSWILYLQGGAWCVSVHDCKKRARSKLGSSDYAPAYVEPQGFLSEDCHISPSYCQWNLVVFHYCDGSSFLGNVSGSSSQLYMRGSIVFTSIVEYLMTSTHLASADNVILAGYSAGGIGALIHADQLHETFFQSVTSFKVLVDAAMFVDMPDVHGGDTMADIFRAVYYLHSLNASNSLQACTHSQASGEEWRCLFPDVFHKFVSSPLFFTNSVFDTWVIPKALKCSTKTCKRDNVDTIHNTRDAVITLAQEIMSANKNYVYLLYCPAHGILISNLFTMEQDNSTVQETLDLWLQNVPVASDWDKNVSYSDAGSYCH